MTENQTLRNLLRSLGSFIGDGAGGLLPKLGWSMADFNNFINRSETDTAWEGYQRRKKQTPESSSSGVPGQKRSAEEEAAGTRPKKARNGDSEGERGQNGFPLLVSMNSPSLGMYPEGPQSQEGADMFSDILRSSSNSAMFMQQPSTISNPPPYGPNPSGHQPSYFPAVNINMESPLSLSYNSSNPPPQSIQQEPTNDPSSEVIDDDDDPTKAEAYKLIQ